MYHLGSAGIAECELADQMERCIYPNRAFHHPDHLRLGWHYLRSEAPADAIARMRRTILDFAVNAGHREKYHDTLTAGWMRLVSAALGCTPQHSEFAMFAAAHPWLFDRDALLAFYSRDLLFSDRARAGWVAPDLHPLPPGA